MVYFGSHHKLNFFFFGGGGGGAFIYISGWVFLGQDTQLEYFLGVAKFQFFLGGGGA